MSARILHNVCSLECSCDRNSFLGTYFSELKLRLDGDDEKVAVHNSSIILPSS